MNKMDELRDIITRRVKTVFIGAISSIENSPYGKLKEGSAEWEKAFRDLRKDILDKGNDQLKLLLEELGDFSVGQKRYTYNMPTLSSRAEMEAYKRGKRDAERGR